MLNKLLLATGIITISFFASAQTTYNSNNYAAVGDSVHTSTVVTGLSSFNFDTTGANFDWDYSSLGLASQQDVKHIDPSSGGYRNSWCASNSIGIGCNTQFGNYTNLGRQALDSINTGGVTFKNIVHHYKQSTGGLVYKMFGATIEKGGIPIAIPVQYTNPDSIYQFPMNYSAKDSNTFSYEMDLNSYGIDFKNVVTGKRVNEVHGWGTIVTPYKTYSNVLKVKTTVYKTDSLYTGQGNTGKVDTLITYSWFDPTVTIPVLKAEATISAGIQVFIKVQYQDSLRCIEPTALFTYSPLVPYYDTTTYSATINFGNLSGSAQSYKWDFGDGDTSILVNPSHTFKCPGTQLVKLYATNSVCNPAKIDTVTIPVYLIDSTNHFQKTSSLEICEGDSSFINGNWEKTTGVYSKTYAAHNGCDSTIIVTLNVISLNKNVTKLGGTLTSNQTGATYQWVDCDNNFALIANETGNSYSVSQTGNYGVSVTKNGCTIQSNCTAVVITNTDYIEEQESQLYPNPATSAVNVILSGDDLYSVEIKNTAGQTLWQANGQKQNVQVDLTALSNGTYLVKIASELTGQVKSHLLIVQ